MQNSKTGNISKKNKKKNDKDFKNKERFHTRVKTSKTEKDFETDRLCTLKPMQSLSLFL